MKIYGSVNAMIIFYGLIMKNGTKKYTIRLLLSDKKQVLDETLIISDLDLKLVQIYFQIGCQIFLLTHNKQEFVSYLV